MHGEARPSVSFPGRDVSKRMKWWGIHLPPEAALTILGESGASWTDWERKLILSRNEVTVQSRGFQVGSQTFLWSLESFNLTWDGRNTRSKSSSAW